MGDSSFGLRLAVKSDSPALFAHVRGYTTFDRKLRSIDTALGFADCVFHVAVPKLDLVDQLDAPHGLLPQSAHVFSWVPIGVWSPANPSILSIMRVL